MISYQLSAEDFPLQVWDLSAGPVVLKPGAEGFEDFEVQEFTSEGPVLDGQRFSGWRARPREVFLPVQLMDELADFDASMGVAFGNLMIAARPGKYFKLQVTSPAGARSLRMRYRPSPTALQHGPDVVPPNIRGLNFIADDPWWHGAPVQKQFQTAESPVQFFETANTHVFNLMSANTVDNASLVNPGERDAWPIYRIDGPSTGFTISQFADVADIRSMVDVPSGEYLILDTRPTVQSMVLSGGGGVYTTDVTAQLVNVGFFRVPAGSSQQIYVTLNGAGSLTVTFTPDYQRAY